MIDDLAETLADGLVSAVGVGREPQVDVFEIACRAAVDPIEYAALPGDGQIEITPARARIVLKERAAKPRQRFTLAHELGHLLLEDPDVALAVRRIAPRLSDSERICDAFAAELLMPRAWIRKRYAARPQDFDTLRDLADTASVSLTAAFVRLLHCGRWRSTLLYFDKHREWKPFVLAGAPANSRGTIEATYATRCELASAFDRQASKERATLHLRVRGQRITVGSEIHTAASGMLALAPLRASLYRS